MGIALSKKIRGGKNYVFSTISHVACTCDMKGEHAGGLFASFAHAVQPHRQPGDDDSDHHVGLPVGGPTFLVQYQGFFRERLPPLSVKR